MLETDASKDGLGAVLLQKGEDGNNHPIAYRSKALSKSEKNYHSSKLEFLALKWAVTKHQGISPILIQTLSHQDGQQPSHVCDDDTQSRCHWTLVGRVFS